MTVCGSQGCGAGTGSVNSVRGERSSVSTRKRAESRAASASTSCGTSSGPGSRTTVRTAPTPPSDSSSRAASDGLQISTSAPLSAITWRRIAPR
ncbi:hypothetical protein SMICM17S_12510 [Streptomyces microflavus]